MHILILTYGSRGDVEPFIALGEGLIAAGFRVTLATSVRFQPMVEAHGLGYAFMNDDLLGIMDTEQGRGLMERAGSFLGAITESIKLMRQLAPAQQALLEESWAAAIDVAPENRPDLMLFHPKAYGAPTLAEVLGIPKALVLPFPMLVPTATAPAPGFPQLPSVVASSKWLSLERLSGRYNRLTYGIIHRLMALAVRRQLFTWQARHHLNRRRLNLLTDSHAQPIPVLHCYSPLVAPVPTDWPKSAMATGYWTLTAPAWQPPPALVKFLAAGPPPIYIGFGSMAAREPGRLAQMVIDALARVGQRGILATGWGGLAPEALPDCMIQIEQAPHGWLLPQVAAVVHHGGAGTTAAGLRAGKPTFITPFFGDQPFWGAQVARLGVGPSPVLQKKLTTDALANAFAEMTTNQAMQQRAQQLGQQLRQEDGIAEAIVIIRTLVAP